MLALMLGSSAARAEDDPLWHGHALIIGASSYADRRWSPLSDIHLQIQQLQAGLKPHFDEVIPLENPTYDQLDQTLRSFLRKYGNDDDARLLIYYAGHGYTETDETRNEYRGFITGVDTPFVDSTRKASNAARPKAISMEAVRGMVSDINARQVLFIFDSCFAGTIFTSRSPGKVKPYTRAEIARMMELPVRDFITAGDANQVVPAHSPLPQLLLNALNGDADPWGVGAVRGQDIAQYLTLQTRGTGLTPREGKLPGGYFDRGEFLFRVTPQQQTTAPPGLQAIIPPLAKPAPQGKPAPFGKPAALEKPALLEKPAPLAQPAPTAADLLAAGFAGGRR